MRATPFIAVAAISAAQLFASPADAQSRVRLNDTFDDGDLATNAHGVGTGWQAFRIFDGTYDAVELNGGVHVSGSATVKGIESNDPIDPTGLTATYVITDVAGSPAYDGIAVGYQVAGGNACCSASQIVLEVRQDRLVFDLMPTMFFDPTGRYLEIARGETASGRVYPGTAFVDAIADAAHPLTVSLYLGASSWRVDVVGGFGVDVHQWGSYRSGFGVADAVAAAGGSMRAMMAAHREGFDATFGSVSIAALPSCEGSVLCDRFDDGDLATNTTGVGSGFGTITLDGAIAATESPEGVAVGGSATLKVLETKDALDPTELEATWVITDVPASPNYDGVIVGFDTAGGNGCCSPSQAVVEIRQERLLLDIMPYQFFDPMGRYFVIGRGELSTGRTYPGNAFLDPIADRAHPITVKMHLGTTRWRIDVTGGYGIDVHQTGAYRAGFGVSDVLAAAGGSTRAFFGVGREGAGAELGSLVIKPAVPTQTLAFCPPLGSSVPTPTGVFDATLLSGLSVRLESLAPGASTWSNVATFTSSTQPALTLLAQHENYAVNVPAATYFTNAANAYRVRVLYNGYTLSTSAVSPQIFTTMRFVSNLTFGIRFRIESREL